MYASIRRYTNVNKETVDELIRRVTEGFVPIIRQVPGFVAYYAIVAEEDVVASISIFEDRDGVELSNIRAADWVKENLAELLPSPAQITAGDVRMHQYNTD